TNMSVARWAGQQLMLGDPSKEPQPWSLLSTSSRDVEGGMSPVEFLRDPPLPLSVCLGYRLVCQAAGVTIPPVVRDIIRQPPVTNLMAGYT
ncbi:MAG TPA: hypothetical protein VES40_00190, partial [Ilumatobacteraceae bacterium]|nr:hypothetical protein [Ilumatobacteraceae bacterium]